MAATEATSEPRIEIVAERRPAYSAVFRARVVAGILQADAYAGFNRLYDAARLPGPITEAGCWAHARRKFFELAELGKAPLAVDAVRRIDAIFTAEREIKGQSADRRPTAHQILISRLVAVLGD